MYYAWALLVNMVSPHEQGLRLPSEAQQTHQVAQHESEEELEMYSPCETIWRRSDLPVQPTKNLEVYVGQSIQPIVRSYAISDNGYTVQNHNVKPCALRALLGRVRAHMQRVQDQEPLYEGSTEYSSQLPENLGREMLLFQPEQRSLKVSVIYSDDVVAALNFDPEHNVWRYSHVKVLGQSCQNDVDRFGNE